MRSCDNLTEIIYIYAGCSESSTTERGCIKARLIPFVDFKLHHRVEGKRENIRLREIHCIPRAHGEMGFCSRRVRGPIIKIEFERIRAGNKICLFYGREG